MPTKFEMTDKALAKRLKRLLASLDSAVDAIEETPIRHELSDRVAQMRHVIDNGTVVQGR